MAKEIHQVREKKKLTREEAGKLILLTAIIFGAVFRIIPASVAGFPINDGGMFYTMIEDLRNNSYAIPIFTSYNGGNIPYAYPPLGFYLGAAITDLFNLSTPLEIIRWLPGILNTLCIPLFYIFSKEILGDNLKAQTATFVFAMTPHLTSWWSMGGGLTRALGVLFMLPALTFIHKVVTSGRTLDIWLAIIFSSLTVLSHTEAPVYIIGIAICIWFVNSRTWKVIIQGSYIVIGVVILTMPWSGWIIHNHGLKLFISAAETGGTLNFQNIFRLLSFDFLTEEPILDLFGVLGFLGFLLLVFERKYLIPGMFLVVYIINPRSSHMVGNIPLAMAASIFIHDGYFSVIKNMILQQAERPPRFLVLILASYIMANSIFYATQVINDHVTSGERIAMQWVAENTPPDLSFLVITGETNGYCDPVREWFPTLANRINLTTIQGNEWLSNDRSRAISTASREIQSCIGDGIDCVTNSANKFSERYTYLYVSRSSPTFNCRPSPGSTLTYGLVLELDASPEFESVFRSNAAVIYKIK